MNSKLQKQLLILEDTTHEIINIVEGLEDSEFHRSVKKKWSIGQILIHIVTSESLALQYMKKKSLGIDDLEDSGLTEAAKFIFLKISQRLPIKYKAPKGIHERTPSASSKEEVFAAWKKVRAELKAFLASIEDKNVNKKIFKHPIAGMLNARQGVAFLREHLLHHKPQIYRMAKHPRATMHL